MKNGTFLPTPLFAPCSVLIGFFRDNELERLTAEQKETLVKELDCSAEKGREEMKRLREGMAELLDDRVGDCVPNIFVSIAKCICPNCQMYLSKWNGRAFGREGRWPCAK